MLTWPALFRRSTVALFERAESFLDAGEYDEALAVGERLIKRRFTGGFEIKARALAELGDIDGAIQTLKEGVECGPSVTILWFLLGNYLSNAGRFDDALSAFYRYRDSGADEAAALYNLGLVYSRKGDADLALQLLEETVALNPNEPVYWSGYAWCRIKKGDPGGALEVLARAEALGANDSAEAHKASALFDLGRIEEARQAAHRSLALDKTNHEAARVLRRLNPEANEVTSVHRALVHGRFPAGVMFDKREGAYGFYATFYVAANDPDEALEFIRPFEPLAEDVTIEKFEQLEPASDGSRGVTHVVSGYTFYQSKAHWLLKVLTSRSARARRELD